MAVLIVLILAAGDQALVVALTAAGRTLEGRRNHQWGHSKCVPDQKQDWFGSFLKTVVIIRSEPRQPPLPRSTRP